MPHLHEALDRLRELATDPFDQGRRFERLIKTALRKHPGIYGDRFEEVWLWNEWPEQDGPDRGIDLVARERDGGHCAIQCKFFAPDRPVPKSQIDKFISASDRETFTSRLIVNTGGVVRRNTLKTLEQLKTPCRVLELADLAAWPVDDWRDFVEEPERLDFTRTRYTPFPYQQEAVDAVVQGFRQHDRGQLILPCGTGKTAVTLWIAETMVGRGGRVLYLVPSISLMAQTMQEWAWQKSVGHRYIGICSDTRAGRNDEDASLLELDLPVTTDPKHIAAGLKQTADESLTVVFCTYQSLELVARAQEDGAPNFDLVVADEAHRTTGADNLVKPGTDTKSSPFQLVHAPQRICAAKRLYATATPRLYTESAKKRASQQEMTIYSMDDEAVYGPEFHRMTFSEAVEGGWLTDYRVAILTLSATELEEWMANLLARERASGLNLEDAALFLGCWDALADPEGRLSGRYRTGDMHNPVRRAIAFSNTIRQSKLVASHWNPVIDTVRDRVDEGERTRLLNCEVQHVDGTFNSLDRTRLLSWLSDGSDDGCRILSNARCLTEGVDVPALDAVLFMHPRKSQIDVVQAVGRVMRRAPGKEYGYIILPVVVPEGVDPEQALNDNQTFKVVWDVLRALRSHDERLDAEINSLDLNRGGSERIFVVKPPPPDVDPILQIPLDLLYDIPPGAIYSRIVEKCGDRQYWPRWAEDVAGIADRIRARVTGLVDDPERITLQQGFRDFLSDMRRTLNPSVSEADVVAMVAQHLVTGPVFQALFATYEFAAHNPVSRALDRLVGLLEVEGLENETRDLEPFYASVRRRARSLDNTEARQTVLLELYERFFSVALRKDAERLGIVYTPVELVDFLLQSADDALRRHLGRSLSDAGVHILDPFTGTGTFIVRLLQNPELIRDEDLQRKFTKELYANEIVLLAYYIAAINIEEAYHGRLDTGAEYRPFNGIALADTFTLSEDRNRFAETMPDNSERVKAQQASPVQVIVGNPPYSAGQRNAADDNPNVVYQHLTRRIEETYTVASGTGLKKTLYDSYKLALRWSSDRIEDKGVVAFITNASFLRGNAEAGVRACLAEEYAEIYVFDLRGNQRTQGEVSRREGGKVFGSGSRAPIALSVLVKDPTHKGPARIHYRDVGDYLTREQKLTQVREFGSIVGITARDDWTTIKPDIHHDWFDQRDPGYETLMPLGFKGAKGQANPRSAFALFSLGVATNRDAWVYDTDPDALWKRIQNMFAYYEDRRQSVVNGKLPPKAALANDAPHRIKWTRGLRQMLNRNQEVRPTRHKIRLGSYRPFTKQHLYYGGEGIEQMSYTSAQFPRLETPNQVIAITGRGETTPFSVLVTDSVPNLHFISSGQCFSRWSYRKVNVDDWTDDSNAEIIEGYSRTDNITDWCLHQFRERYGDPAIAKDHIWQYIYGVLHAADFRKHFAANLAKDLPRIPLAPDFTSFRDAGTRLIELHLSYETCLPWPVEFHQTGDGTLAWRLTRPMRWLDKTKRDSLQVTPQVIIRGIPPEAHDYSVNGRTPLEWAIDRLRIRTDKTSGIVNDPNAWFANNPVELGTHLARLVTVSVGSTRIIRSLPDSLYSIPNNFMSLE